MSDAITLTIVWFDEAYDFEARWEIIDGVRTLRANLNSHPHGERIMELMKLGAEPRTVSDNSAQSGA